MKTMNTFVELEKLDEKSNLLHRWFYRIDRLDNMAAWVIYRRNTTFGPQGRENWEATVSDMLSGDSEQSFDVAMQYLKTLADTLTADGWRDVTK